MNRWSIIIAFLYVTTLAQAQKVTVSDEITLRNDLSYDLVGKIDSHFILFRDRGNKFEARIYDQELKLKMDKDITLSDRNCNIYASLATANSYFIF